VTNCHPLPSPESNARARCGVTSVPPLATAAIIVPSARGVTETAPWPIATEIVSPAYHFSCIRWRFHSVDGTRPCASFGRAMALNTPIPSAVAHLVILATPTMFATV